MSNSNRGGGIVGAVAAGCLLLLIGAGYYAYQYNQVIQSAMYATDAPPVSSPDTLNHNDDSLVQADISSKLMTQQEAWNKGDLDAFMQVYWDSERLTFASGGKVTRGWQATLDGYKSKYSTKEKMGQLTFGNLEFERLDKNVMLVLGTWHLEREVDSVGGNFSLVWMKQGEQWLIAHDHTSALTTTPPTTTPSKSE